MAWKKNNPGCNASGGCKCEGESDCGFFVDDFEGVNGAELSPERWEASEAIMILDNAALMYDTSALAVSTVVHPDGLAAVVVTGAFYVDGLDASLRLFANYVDDSNYLYADLHVNGASSELRVGKRVGGVDEQLNQHTVSAADSVLHVLKLYWDGEEPHTFSAVFGGVTLQAVIDDGGIGSLTRTPVFGMAAAPVGGNVFVESVAAEKYGLEGVDCPKVSPCLIAAEGFAATTSDVNEVNFISASGTWSTAGGSLLTSSTNAKAIFKTQHPRFVSSQMVSALFSGADGDVIDIIVGYKDSSTGYYMARFEIGGCVYMYSVASGGGLTLLGILYLSLADATAIDATVYLGQGKLVVSVGSLIGSVSATTDAAAADRVGIGTGGTAAGVSISSFSYWRHKSDHPTETNCPAPYIPMAPCLLIRDFFEDPFWAIADVPSPCIWTIASGTWTVTRPFGGSLRQLTCATTGVIDCNVITPDGSDEGTLEVVIDFPSINDEVKLHIGGNSCTIKRTSSTNWLVNGLTVVLGSSVARAARVRFCFLGVLKSVNIFIGGDEDSPTSWIGVTPASGTNSFSGQASLEVSNNVSGAVKFSDFRFYDNEGINCPRCLAGCSECLDNTYLIAIAGQVTGVLNNSNASPVCNLTCCDTFNGWKIFDRHTGTIPPSGCNPTGSAAYSGAGCNYQYIYPGPPYCEAHTGAAYYPFYWLNVCVGGGREFTPSTYTRHILSNGTFGFGGRLTPPLDGSNWDRMCEHMGDIEPADWQLISIPSDGTGVGGCGYCNFSGWRFQSLIPIFALGVP